MDPRPSNKGLAPSEQIDATDRVSWVEDPVMDVTALEWKTRFEEAEKERLKLVDFLEAIRSGQIDSIVSNDQNRWLRVLEPNVLEEKERQIHELFVDVERERYQLAQAFEAIQSGQVDSIVANDKTRLLRLLNSPLLEEIESLVKEVTRSNQKFRQVFELSNDGIIIFGPDGNIVDANQKSQDMWGYTHAKFLELNLSDLHHSHGEDEAERLLRLSELENTHRTGLTLETEYKRKDGSMFAGEVSGVGMILEGQALVLGIVRDLTQRKKAEAEQEALNKQLIDASRQAGMADVATGVLHNVGNVLNSVTVSAGVVQKIFRDSSMMRVSQTMAMVQEHATDLPTYFTQDPKGRLIPAYLRQLGEHLNGEQATILRELQELEQHIEHIKEIVNVQQTHARSRGMLERVVLTDLMDQACKVNALSLERHQVEVVREYTHLTPVLTDRHQVLQILVNLISNAKEAIVEGHEWPRRLTLRVQQPEGDLDSVCLQVADNGIGIKPEHLPRMFAQGFTTKKTGHGFGLHSAALSAKMLGGSLAIHSDGADQGATFTLELPMNPLREEEKNVDRDLSLIAQEESGATSHE